MDPFVCLICGFRAQSAGDCPHCALPVLDSRLDDVQEAIGKADEARRHKHEQKLLWLAVGLAVFVLALVNLTTLVLGIILPVIQQVAFGLLIAFGTWRGLVKLFPPHRVAPG